MRERRHPFKAILSATIGLALLLTWFRSMGALGYVHDIVLALWLPWPIAAGCLFRPGIRPPAARFMANVLLGFSLAITIYLAWAHQRLTSDVIFNGPDIGFPYPDQALRVVEQWFRARHPTPPDTIRLHDQVQEVAVVLGLLISAFSGLAAFLIGILVQRPAIPTPAR